MREKLREGEAGRMGGAWQPLWDPRTVFPKDKAFGCLAGSPQEAGFSGEGFIPDQESRILRELVFDLHL